MNTLIALVATLTIAQMPRDAKIEDLKDGYSRVATASYSIELPTGWTCLKRLDGASAKQIRRALPENLV